MQKIQVFIVKYLTDVNYFGAFQTCAKLKFWLKIMRYASTTMVISSPIHACWLDTIFDSPGCRDWTRLQVTQVCRKAGTLNTQVQFGSVKPNLRVSSYPGMNKYPGGYISWVKPNKCETGPFPYRSEPELPFTSKDSENATVLWNHVLMSLIQM